MELNIIPKFIDEAANAPARAVGDTLADLWKLGIGSHVSLWSKKQEFRQQINLQKYRRKIEEKTQSISHENLIEPQLHIVGPAIEASKYYIEHDELREMFANLIASSINKDKISQVHPALVEIIKQMSPLDAQNLKSFGNVKNHPIVNYLHVTDTGSVKIIEHVFLKNAHYTDLEQISNSISNLKRLGIVDTNYMTHFSNNDYECFKKHEIYKGWTESFEMSNQITKQALKRGELKSIPPEAIDYSNRIEIEKGIIELTPLGESFKRICISE